MAETLEHSQWKGTTGGMPWMQRSLVSILGHTDQRIVYAFVALIVPFYMLFAHFGYIAQYRFFRQRFGESPLKQIRAARQPNRRRMACFMALGDEDFLSLGYVEAAA